LTEDRIYVERAQNGDMAAFRELVERYKHQVYYLALDMMSNPQDAEDMSQEVFIKAYRYLNSFRGDAKFSSWLYRITMNTCIDHRRKKSMKSMKQTQTLNEKELLEPDSFSVDAETHPERKTEANFIQKHIDQALQKLTDKERAIFILRHYHEKKFHEIANIRKITVGSAKGTLFRAIRKLQKELAFYKADLGLETVHE
jgi:RNA polymerase sigma-70 factor (ECF subfamily)